MLKYFVLLTSDLAATCIILGMLYSYFKHNLKRIATKTLVIVGVATVVASIVMTAVLNTSNPISKKLNLGYLTYMNITLYLIFAVAFLVFLVFLIPPLLKKTKKLGEIVSCVSASVLIFTLLFIKLPTVFAYPFNFDVADNTIFSTDFIYRFVGFLFGIALSILVGFFSYKVIRDTKSKMSLIFVYIEIFIQAFYYSGLAIKLLITRRIIKQTHFLFEIVKIVNNYSKYFIIIMLIVAVVAGIILIINNLKVTDEYSNPAELRKIKAKMRNRRRVSVALFVCVALAIFVLTFIDAYNNKEPDEAPVEECIDEGENLVVPYEYVEDGHLHRFAYTTEDGVQVKFIIVQKPGTTTYGVGLDACDICGDAGYYERGDQIVCRRCDVVMNKNTIGLPGGCNPIVIDYYVENAKIYVPKATLVEHQDEFK
ncbi:MAG: DUF2318 domain-containing protein [Lachnospiraceae bacterium]|nr:DUF2318 domain-containing protein [Lachnospiraceae bacterium]